ncbi:hypothetical protein JX265_012906 [Neoarthrinium moseri]|uniref:Heterokaryon incompatibility domain-containing protein n=1 Tax=Neoarthrinium moseri TaxID=1658444 RepID=A0A9Q0AJ18_9PEZI|nr:hypothetical protein JX265_012906 [Neoarthrinium moseri]
MDFPVTRNLAQALARMRFVDGKDRVLWVDAVCINQSSIDERNAQVLRMADIYGSASRVMVWLGESSTESRSAVSFFSKWTAPNWDAEKVIDSYATNNQKWRDLTHGLLEREWWTRMWIVQEVVLARAIVIQCGPDTLSWDLLAAISMVSHTNNLVLEYSSKTAAFDGFRYAPMTLTFVQIEYQENGRLPLSTLMVKFSKNQCREPSDRVYALLGMATNPKYYQIKPNYRTNPAIVYMGATERFIREVQSLDIICLGRGTNRDGNVPMWKPGLRGRSRLAGLPSWSPDFRTRPGEDPASLTRLGISETPGFSACGTRKPIIRFLPSGKLLAMGAEAGCIGALGATSEIRRKGDNNDPDLGEHIGNILQEAVVLALGGTEMPLYHTLYPFAEGMTYHEVLSRVLVCDTNAYNQRCKKGEGRFQADNVPPADFEAGLNERVRQQSWSSKVGLMKSHWRDGRRLMVLTAGLLGLAPEGAREGDFIIILFGCSVPLVMRSHGNDFEVIGECYVHGIMNGEYLDVEPSITEFSLI